MGLLLQVQNKDEKRTWKGRRCYCSRLRWYQLDPSSFQSLLYKTVISVILTFKNVNPLTNSWCDKVMVSQCPGTIIGHDANITSPKKNSINQPPKCHPTNVMVIAAHPHQQNAIILSVNYIAYHLAFCWHLNKLCDKLLAI